jgi:hypothetical protein
MTIGWETGDEEGEWTPLASSNLSAFRYDARAQILEVRFVDGREYRYRDVDRATVDGLSAAPSAGKYFNSVIKEGGYTYEEI